MAIGVGGGNLTPGVDNFSTLKRKVVNYVQAPNDSDILDAAGCAINTAINRLNSRNWNWNLREQDITLAASDIDYTVNANFRMPRKATLLDSSSNFSGFLNFLDPKTFLDIHPSSSSTGYPTSYTVVKPKQDLELLLDVLPSSSFVTQYPTLRLFYYARVLTLSSDASIPDVTPEAEPYLMWAAREDVALQYGEPSLADRAGRQAAIIWQSLVRDDMDTMTDWEHQPDIWV